MVGEGRRRKGRKAGDDEAEYSLGPHWGRCPQGLPPASRNVHRQDCKPIQTELSLAQTISPNPLPYISSMTRVKISGQI